MSVNTSSDKLRGSYNAAESGWMSGSNKKQFKYVYDFNTTQGNGLISSLALTSNAAGSCYLYGDKNQIKKNNLAEITSSTSSYSSYSATSPYNLD